MNPEQFSLHLSRTLDLVVTGVSVVYISTKRQDFALVPLDAPSLLFDLPFLEILISNVLYHVQHILERLV